MYMSIFVKTQWTCWSSLWGMFVNPLKCKQEAYYFLYDSTYLCNLAYILLNVFFNLSFLRFRSFRSRRSNGGGGQCAACQQHIRVYIWCIYAVCVYTCGCAGCQQHTQYAYKHMGVKHANSISECVCGVSTQYAYTHKGYMEE